MILDSTKLDRFAFTDPASGKSQLKKTRARQAACVIASDHLRRIFLLYVWAGRLPTSQYIDKLINICNNYKPKVFGIEANAMQSLFADVVRDKAKRKMQRVPFRPVTQTTKVEKDFRIRTTIEPVLAQGRLFMLEIGQEEAWSELRGFPTAQTKDIVDCLASAIALVPPRTTPQQRNDELESLATYLRNSGAPSWYIEQRITELTKRSYS